MHNESAPRKTGRQAWRCSPLSFEHFLCLRLISWVLGDIDVTKYHQQVSQTTVKLWTRLMRMIEPQTRKPVNAFKRQHAWVVTPAMCHRRSGCQLANFVNTESWCICGKYLWASSSRWWFSQVALGLHPFYIIHSNFIRCPSLGPSHIPSIISISAQVLCYMIPISDRIMSYKCHIQTGTDRRSPWRTTYSFPREKFY